LTGLRYTNKDLELLVQSSTLINQLAAEYIGLRSLAILETLAPLLLSILTQAARCQ